MTRLSNIIAIKKLHECDEKFPTAHGLQYHLTRSHGNFKIQCNLCHMTLTSKSNLLSHLTFICAWKITVVNIVRNIFFGAIYSKDHMKQHEQIDIYLFPIYSYLFLINTIHSMDIVILEVLQITCRLIIIMIIHNSVYSIFTSTWISLEKYSITSSFTIFGKRNWKCVHVRNVMHPVFCFRGYLWVIIDNVRLKEMSGWDWCEFVHGCNNVMFGDLALEIEFLNSDCIFLIFNLDGFVLVKASCTVSTNIGTSGSNSVYVRICKMIIF